MLPGGGSSRNLYREGEVEIARSFAWHAIVGRSVEPGRKSPEALTPSRVGRVSRGERLPQSMSGREIPARASAGVGRGVPADPRELAFSTDATTPPCIVDHFFLGSQGDHNGNKSAEGRARNGDQRGVREQPDEAHGRQSERDPETCGARRNASLARAGIRTLRVKRLVYRSSP